MTEHKNVDYFLNKITHYTKNHLKPIHDDHDFLNYRSRLATKAYEGCLAAGNPEKISFDIASDILLDGLRSNEFMRIDDLLDRHYTAQIQQANKHRLVVLLVTACEPIFNKYIKADVTDTKQQSQLQQELLQMLDTWFACNPSHALLHTKNKQSLLIQESA